MKNKTLVIVGVIALTLVIAGAAAAQGASAWGQNRRSRFLVRHLIHDLNLTDAQQAQIKTILQNERPAIEAISEKIEQGNEQLRSKPTFDEEFVRSVAEQQAANFADAVVEKEKIRSEIFAVLNPEQQQKLNQISEDFRAAMRDRLETLGDGL
jgi:periplasmic protein CpxP/Spy